VDNRACLKQFGFFEGNLERATVPQQKPKWDFVPAASQAGGHASVD